VTFFAGLGGFALIAVLLYWAKAVLIPIALAVLLTFLLSPLVIRLQRWGLPKAVAVPLVLLLALAIVGGIGWVVTAQVISLVDELPGRRDQILAQIERLSKSLQSDEEKPPEQSLGRLVEDIGDRIKEKTEPDTKDGIDIGPIRIPVGPLPVRVEGDDDLAGRLEASLSLVAPPLATAGLTVVLVVFMLFKREDLRNRIVTLSGRAHLAVTTKALDDAGRRIARYLLMQFVINVTYGLVFALGLFLLGVPYAALWGTAAAVLRYVPYIGPWVAAALPVTYSLLTSPDWGRPFGAWGQPLAVVGLVLALELLSNNVMEPLLYGRGVGVSEVAVILSAIVWGWLWGPIGLVLATPMTACLVVAGRYVPALSLFNRILGDAPEVEPHVVYYQRLLARDEDEAEEIFDDEVARSGLASACEAILVPTLQAAKRDRMRGLLDPGDITYILESIVEHTDEGPGPETARQDPAGLADGRPLVLGYAVRDPEDDAALRILARLVADGPCRFEVLSRDVLLSELLADVRERRPSGLCLVSLPPGGMTRARSLVKRLRLALPDLKIAIARWEAAVPERHRAALHDEGATYVGRTPADSSQQVISMARLTPAAEPTAALS
jgi:predicted PurR-regulated permease PerM